MKELKEKVQVLIDKYTPELSSKGLKRKLSFVQIEGFWRFLDVSPDAIQSKNQKVINNSNVYSGNSYNRLVISHYTLHSLCAALRKEPDEPKQKQ